MGEIIPCFHDVSISLLRVPHVDLSFLVGSFELMNLGLGVYNLSNLGGCCLSEFLCSKLLHPRTFKYVLESKYSSFPHHPVGLLKISMWDANDAELDEYFLDPFIVVNLGTNAPSIDNGGKKFWKEVESVKMNFKNMDSSFCMDFYILIYDKLSDMLEVCIQDYEKDSRIIELGHVNIDLCRIPLKRSIEHEMNLFNNSEGKMILRYLYLPLLRCSQKQQIFNEDEAFFINIPNFSKVTNEIFSLPNKPKLPDALFGADFAHDCGTWKDVRDGNENTTFLNSSANVGVLIVSSIKCKNLRATPSFMDILTPSNMKVYVKLEVNDVTHTTRIVVGKHDPTFPGEFKFVVTDLIYSILSITVIDAADMFSSRVIGSINLNVNDFVNDSGVENEYLIQGNCEECFIAFKCSWYIA